MSSQLKLLTRTFRSIATYVHTITYLCVWWSMGFYSGINPAGKTSGPPKRPAIPQALDPSNHLRKLMWPMDVPKAARYSLAYPDIPLRLCTTKIYQDLSSISSRPLDLDISLWDLAYDTSLPKASNQKHLWQRHKDMVQGCHHEPLIRLEVPP